MAAELTDEQITELWSWSASKEAEQSGAPTQQHAFARAILALATKQATQGAEPVAGYCTGIAWHPKTTWQSEQVIKITRKAQAAHGFVVPLYTAPPPTVEVEKDAARYRFLRGSPWDWQVEHLRSGWATYYGGKNLDAAIDAAIKSDQAQAGKGDGSSLAKEAPHG